MAPSSLLTVISSGLGGGGVARARFFEASSSGVMMSVGLAVALGVQLPLGLVVTVGVPLAFGVAVTTEALLLAVLEAFCSCPSLHPVKPEQASKVKASAV